MRRRLSALALLAIPAALPAQTLSQAQPTPVLSNTTLRSTEPSRAVRAQATSRPVAAARAHTALTSAGGAPTVALSITTMAGTATTTAPLMVPVRLTATVTPAVPGFVNFCDTRYALCAGPGLLATGAVQPNGTVTMPVTPTTGPHNIRAVYVANTTYAGAASAATTLTVGNLAVALLDSSGSTGNYSLTSHLSFFGQATTTPQPSGHIDIQDASNNAHLLTSGALGASSGGSYYFNSASGTLPVDGPVGAVTADLNEDGFLDTAITSSGGPTLNVVIGGPTGPTEGTTWTAPGFPAPTALAGGDFDRDGHYDLVVAASNIMVFLQGNGTAKFAPVEQVIFPTGANVKALSAADIDGDGVLDLVAMDAAAGNVYVYSPLTPGGAPDQLAGTYAVGSAPTSMAVGDLNGDGLPDIVVSNSGSGSFSVLLNTGSGFSRVDYPVPGTAGSVALADFYGTGSPAVAIGAAGSGDFPLVVYANDGAGGFTPARQLAADGDPAAGVPFVITDGNNDGIPDLTFANTNGESITWNGPGSGDWVGYSSPSVVANPTVLAPGTPGYTLSAGVFVVNQRGEVGYAARVNGFEQTNTFDGISVVGTGSHNVVANYAGDSNFVGYGSQPVALTAAPLPSSTGVTMTPSPSTYGQQVTMTATVSATGGADTQGHVAGGTVTFSAGGRSYGPYTVSGGVATGSATDLPMGQDAVTASYSGDDNFTASSGAVSQAVQGTVGLYSVPTQATPGTAYTPLTATGVFSGPAIPTAGVVIQVDGGASIVAGCSTWAATGICSVNYPTAALAAGNHTVVVSYPGDANYPGLSTTGSLLVLDGATSIPISVPYVNGAAGSSSVALTANVHVPGPVPGTVGQVYFQVDGGPQVIANCALTGGNNATCSASYPAAGLAAGYHSVAFVVPADGYYVQSAGGNGMLLK